MRKWIVLLSVALLLMPVTGARAGDEPGERVRRLALHLKNHYSYRDFNDYGAVAYGKVYEMENGLVNAYYADQNENRRIDASDSLHIVNESGGAVISFVDMGLDGIRDDEDLAGEVNAVGAVKRKARDQGLKDRYLLLVDDLLSRH